IVPVAQQIVAEGIDVLEAIQAASEAIRQVGDAYEAGELFLPDLMIAGEKMKRCMDIFRPHLKVGAGPAKSGKVVLGTVSGDIHDIGKNLVGTMLAVGGYELIDLGVSVPPLNFVTTARDKGADVLALSALMTASLPYQQEVIQLLKEMGLREKVFVIVGGGPVTAEFARRIGADGWAENAAGALKLVDRILSEGKGPAQTFVSIG
ncbi:MAG: cobalamin-dependent protein, partial [Anaerolineae bacterium]